jgi:hypothetical protein
VARQGRQIVVLPGEVHLGEMILVKPGSTVAVDGDVIEGYSSLVASQPGRRDPATILSFLLDRATELRLPLDCQTFFDQIFQPGSQVSGLGRASLAQISTHLFDRFHFLSQVCQ